MIREECPEEMISEDESPSKNHIANRKETILS